MNRFGLNTAELRILSPLETPALVQDFLDTLPINFEPHGDSCMSPRRVIACSRCHCIEGALLALLALRLHRLPGWLMDLKATADDLDHIVCLFRERNRWGAISKTNHAVLRYREPVYASPRELALSFFHEYRNDAGRITLRKYSRPVRVVELDRIRPDWPTAADDLWEIGGYLDEVRHYPILRPAQARRLRVSNPVERTAGKLIEWHAHRATTKPWRGMKTLKTTR